MFGEKKYETPDDQGNPKNAKDSQAATKKSPQSSNPVKMNKTFDSQVFLHDQTKILIESKVNISYRYNYKNS